MKKFVLMITMALFFLAFFHQATAASVNPKLQTVVTISPLQIRSAKADCLNLTTDLTNFKENYLGNAHVISQYALAMGEVSKSWHAELEPFENNTVNFATDTFLPMTASADSIDASVKKMIAWMEQIDADIETFTSSIESCKLSKGDYDKWLSAFQGFSEKSGESLGVTIDFISSMAADFRDWQGKLSQFENQEVLLPAGQFDVVTVASDGLFESAELIESNAQVVIDELAGISLKEHIHGRGANDGTLQLYRR